ncbi:MAG: C39 family peptidase [Bacillota bacterium]
MDPHKQNQWVYTTINGVDQWTGCAPTAALNIMAYWAAQGYPSLNPTNSTSDITMQLRKDMGTWQSPSGAGTTDPNNIPLGMKQYASRAGLSTPAANVTFATFGTVVWEIDLMRPVLQSYWSQSYFGDHTLVVVGYKEYVRSSGSNSQYVVARNNWDGEPWNLYVKWGTWTANTVTKFRPVQ